jgi:hypothetical protein
MEYIPIYTIPAFPLYETIRTTPWLLRQEQGAVYTVNHLILLTIGETGDFSLAASLKGVSLN